MSSVVVVTGAASGIGRATTERLAGADLTVVGVDQDASGLESVGKDLPECFVGVSGDVVDRATHERAVLASSERGTLAGWVNCAGIWAQTRAHDLNEVDLDRILAVNLKGSIIGCSVACAHFLSAGTSGAIVNVSSIEAVVAFPDALAYEASKGGIDALTRQIAVDYGRVGVRCNGVRPGAIMTPLAEGYLAGYPGEREKLVQSWRDLSVLDRVGQPEEVAAVVAFLLSDDARFMTGSLVTVDGGATARCFAYPPNPDIVERQ
jgi:NAD(P)-dependent dehydrogenase (short-subunit alcohol dehydrogenase family)